MCNNFEINRLRFCNAIFIPNSLYTIAAISIYTYRNMKAYLDEVEHYIHLRRVY